MSGHSKWATIHRGKEIKDNKRGQVFTKIGNAITIAVKAGGGITDPDKNFRLRLAIEKARTANMPKENIKRAIDRASGKLAGSMEEITDEGYGPGGVAIVIEIVTDNRNRTTQAIKNIFDRGGGRLAGPGSVAFQFQKAGLLTVAKSANAGDQILKIMDLGGVEDVEEVTDAIDVYTKPEETAQVKDKLVAAGFEILQMEQILKPVTTVKIDDKSEAGRVLRLVENLEDQDDVQRVFANFDIPDEILNENQ